MIAGSMFGWTLPGASPQWYLDNAKYVNSNTTKGHIKDPVLSAYYPFNDFLLRYEIMGKQRLYLPMSALPKELMSADAQFNMQPDLVLGMPVMPVTATFGDNGSCTIQLEDGSYTAEREINAEYQITARVRVGNAEFVVGEHPKAPDRFVTWERNCQNDGDGPPNYYRGHYGLDRAAIIEDFSERVSAEHQRLHPAPERNAGKERGEAR